MRTEGYFAPELIGGKISSKSDVYSFGVVRNSIICIVKDDNKNVLFICIYRLFWKPFQDKRLMTKHEKTQNW